MKFRVLFLFSSSSLLLFEIKRLDLPASAEPSQLYHWYQYEPDTDQLQRLDFESMLSDPPFEVREFRQGTLRFSDISGIFRPAQPGKTTILHREFLLELPPPLAERFARLPMP